MANPNFTFDDFLLDLVGAGQSPIDRSRSSLFGVPPTEVIARGMQDTNAPGRAFIGGAKPKGASPSKAPGAGARRRGVAPGDERLMDLIEGNRNPFSTESEFPTGNTLLGVRG